MPQPENLLKAQLQKITWDDQQEVQDAGEPFPVQFNPESLRVAYANQSANGGQRGGSAVQYVGQGTTRLSFDLWFDVTAASPHEAQNSTNDVRRLTEQVVDLIRPTATDEEDKFIPPGVRFLWGTFLFEGILDSVNESLEYFSEDGKPLRSSLSIQMSKQDVNFEFGSQTGSGLGSAATPGTQAPQTARQGDSIQSMAARIGQQDNWQAQALLNNIDQPRIIATGTPMVKLGASVQVGAKIQIGR